MEEHGTRNVQSVFQIFPRYSNHDFISEYEKSIPINLFGEPEMISRIFTYIMMSVGFCQL